MATSPPIPSVDTFTPTPIGIRPSDDSFAEAAGAGAAVAAAGADEESGESGMAAARRAIRKLLSNNSTASTETLRMAAPQERELSTPETLDLLSGSHGW